MDGFKRLVFRLTPIMMLICFICIGITHTFSRPSDTQPLTYLTNETITVNDNGTETTEDDITITNYSFDFATYRQNISVDKLKNSTQNVLDLQAYENTLSTFNLLWEDGYQFGDISRTILNAVILVINTLFVSINIFIVPIRIGTAILLTILSLIGINISRTEGIIIPFLNFIVDKATIPLINTTEENTEEIYESLTNTTWVFNNKLEIPQNTAVTIKTGIQFTSNNTSYNKIQIANTKGVGLLANTYVSAILYGDTNGNWTQVYTDGNWINNNYKTIYFGLVNNKDSNTTLSIWLNKLATKQQTTPVDTTIYEWNDIQIQSYTTNNVETYFLYTTFESNNEQFSRAILTVDSTDLIIAYIDYEGNAKIVFYRNVRGWTNLNYEQFTLTNTQPMNSSEQFFFNTLITKQFIQEVT